jgi:glucose/arabinose dehydrogenase
MMKQSGQLAMALVTAAVGWALLGAEGVAAQAGAQPVAAQGRGGAPGGAGRGGGRGPAPECLKPVVLAAECSIAPSEPTWADPVALPDGPIMVQSAVNQHRDLRVFVTKGLVQPWSMTWLPDGTMLVTERGGRLRVVRKGVLDPNPVAGAPAVHAQGLQGLMDVIPHPRFAENGYIYLSYHKPIPDPRGGTTPAGQPVMAGATTIARGTWNGKALVDVKDIWHDPQAVRTESSRIGFARDGMLHMSVSASGTGADVMRSADPGDIAGKTIRLRDDGTIPPDNPFFNRAGYKKEIYTLGHRNGHSMQLNPETGEFWVTEQGPNGGDEINVLKPGANYGWPYVSHGRNYMGPRISETPGKEGTEQPTVVWVPSIAVTGGTFYMGDAFPGWRRNFFVGGLREGEIPRTGQIQRIVFNDRWEEIRREPMLRDLHQRIRDVRQGPDGFLYALTAAGCDYSADQRAKGVPFPPCYLQGAILRIEPVTQASVTAPR